MKKNDGLILTEVLMSVSLLAVASIIMGSLISSSVSATRASKEYLVAQNLVTEGIEAVKNIRDTNWLRYPKDEGCWLNIDGNYVEDCLNSGLQPETGANYLPIQKYEQWVLEESSNSQTQLDLSLGESVMTPYVVYREETPIVKFFNSSDPNPTGVEPSGYYRSVFFTNYSSSYATVEVTVQWRSESKVKTVSRTINLYNYN